MSHLQELNDVLDHIRQAWEQGKKTALLVITQVSGASYRLPGAKMMIASDEAMFGTLSGGCLESDLLGWAEKVMQEQVPTLVRYDLSENELWSLGIGCKGTLEILVMPVEPGDHFWNIVQQKALADKSVSLILEIPTGVRVVLDSSGKAWGDVQALPDVVLREAYARMERQTRAEIMVQNDRQFVIDSIRPSERLVIAGAGHDAVPLALLASKAGFSTVILDPRPQFNSNIRFPTSTHCVKEPLDVWYTEFAACWWVIMNHHINRDRAALKLALMSDPKFVGVLGPLSRTKEMLTHIGYHLHSGPIFAPVGLDLAAETPDEVAISIVSQLMALRNHRDASILHGRKKIHA